MVPPQGHSSAGQGAAAGSTNAMGPRMPVGPGVSSSATSRAQQQYQHSHQQVHRAPGSFSTNLLASASTPSLVNGQRPQLRRLQTDSSDETLYTPPALQISKQRSNNAQSQVRSQRTNNIISPISPISNYYVPPRKESNPSFNRNESRSSDRLNGPSAPFHQSERIVRTGSPLISSTRSSTDLLIRSYTRKHSSSQQGFFEPSLPSSSFIASNIGGGGPSGGANSSRDGSSTTSNMAPNPNLSASQIAAQAAMHNQSQHMRQRSQTLPRETNSPVDSRRTSASKGVASPPPTLSLTEASGGRVQNGFGDQGHQQTYKNGLLGGGIQAATTAANLVFPRSPSTSPNIPPTDFIPPYREPEKAVKPEKSSKVNKIFSRPSKISTKEVKEKALPSPHKLGQSMAALQRNNPSSTTISDHSHTLSASTSMYSLQNSSSATIRPSETPVVAEKEKKQNFLSRQKNKLSSKDSDHHLQLSSAASNSRPVDPHAPSTLYNFNLPSSPGPSSTSFSKSMSGLDLRHGGRALREKKKEEKASDQLREIESNQSDWPGPSSLGSLNSTPFLGPAGGTGAYSSDIHQELMKYGLSNMTPDDAWPFLKAKLLGIFEGEDLRLPVEDFNRLVTTHLQRCIQKRTPTSVVEDLRDLLTTGFNSLDLTLRRTADERLIPHLVDIWLTTFTVILPFIQAVFLPLDLEFAGQGPLMSREGASDFWGALPTIGSPSRGGSRAEPIPVPAGQILDVRRIVLNTYRDVIILPRYQTLTNLFSRLSLESINTNLNLDRLEALSSSPSSGRPSTAMSLDPSTASYNSQTTTLLGQVEGTPIITGARSRAISNVSFGSDRARDMTLDSNIMPPPARPFTPGSTHPSLSGLSLNTTSTNTTSQSSKGEQERSDRAARAGEQAQREMNTEDSGKVAETVGRMLQCMSVLSSVGVGGGVGGQGEDSSQRKMEELCRGLKLNWLGRGRTGRNRRGFVGARVRCGAGRTGGGGEEMSML